MKFSNVVYAATAVVVFSLALYGTRDVATGQGYRRVADRGLGGGEGGGDGGY